VPKKEGMIHQVSTVDDIVRHNKTKFLDNNILALRGHEKILQELVDKNIRCQFNQGLDIRLVNSKNAKLLAQMNYLGNYIFAFDNVTDEELIHKKLGLFKQYVGGDWRIKFFIYCHPDMNLKHDVIHRVEWCRKNRVLPYLMRDLRCWDFETHWFYTDLAAYCNQPGVFKNMSFAEYAMKRRSQIPKAERSMAMYYDGIVEVVGQHKIEDFG